MKFRIERNLTIQRVQLLGEQLTTTGRRKLAGIQKGRWTSTLANHRRVRHFRIGVYVDAGFEQVENI